MPESILMPVGTQYVSTESRLLRVWWALVWTSNRHRLGGGMLKAGVARGYTQRHMT